MARKSHISLLLIASLCLFSVVSAAVFLSYDCGSSDLIYTDRNGIIWTGDNTIMPSNGISQTVQPANSMSQVMNTLRVFSTGKRKKYCYTIKLDGGRPQQVLVRASFYYGNYDNKSSPPSFDLQFDGNNWDTVVTMMDRIVYYEVTYVPTKDYISVCLAQTLPYQFPFISALEVRTLGPLMYGDISSAYALFLKRRVAYGTNETIRYPDDMYDRIWSPIPGGNGLIPVSNEALFINSNGGDNPPEKALKSAITTSNTSESIQLGTGGFPLFEIPVYMTMYFSEVTRLDASGSTQKRSFTVYNGNESFSSIISPPYGNFTEMFISNITVSSNTTFYLVATPDSTLPPLINAMEIFYISDPLAKGTNSKDVDGISSLQNDFEALQDWGGDPCLPAPYSWEWLNCSDDSIPRITALYLSSFNLSGPLPDFSSMDNLEIIDLSNNSLTGEIPDFLGSFPNLKQLDLSDNLFSGPVPTSLSNKNDLNLVVTGNPDLCTANSGNSCQRRNPSSGSSNRPMANNSKKKKKNKLPIIIGTAIPAFILIWAVIGILAILRHNKGKTAAMVAAASQGQIGGGNMSPMPLLNRQLVGNVGEVAMNQIKVDTNQSAQQAN